MTLAKPEWGTKRQCGSCGSRFYDLTRTPIVCPKCGAAYEGEQTFKSRRSSAPAEKAIAAVKPEAVIDLDDETLIVLDDDDDLDAAAEVSEEEDESLIEDASDLGEDDDDMAEVMEHLDEEGGDEA
jgi:uncharacterized protein (TIGR02300 family)